MADTSGKYILKFPSGKEITITAEQAASYNQGANKLAPGFSVRPVQATTQFINAEQDATIAQGAKKDEAPTKQSLTDQYSSAFSSLKDVFMSDMNAPEPISMMDMYKQYRKDMNMDDLEATVNDLTSQADLLREQQRMQSGLERNKPVAMNVIEGRIGQEERQMMERLDSINRQKDSAVRQLQSANATIENMMSFAKMDYDTARNSYNDQFSQQMQLFSMTKGIVDAQNAERNRQEDNARANLNIIYGSIRDGGMSVDTMTPQQQYEISRMELEAGLPTGFYNNIVKTNPDSKVLSSTTRESGGTKYADVIMQNKDGSIFVKTVSLGASGSGSGTDANGDGIVDPKYTWEEYLAAAQEELNMSVAPDSQVYAELKAQYEKDFGATTTSKKFTDTELKKLEQAGLLNASRQEQLDFLYGEKLSPEEQIMRDNGLL